MRSQSNCVVVINGKHPELGTAGPEASWRDVCSTCGWTQNVRMQYMRCSLRLGHQHYDAASWARAERSRTSIVSGASGAWTTERMLLNSRGALTQSFASGASGVGAFTWLIVQLTDVRAVVSLMDGPLRELGVQLSGIWVVFSSWAGQFKRDAAPCVWASGLSSTRTEAPAQAHFVSLSRFGNFIVVPIWECLSLFFVVL